MKPWKKVTAKTARELCDRFKPDLGAAAKALLKDDMTPQAYFDALIAAGLSVEAAKFLAFCLPKREAAWWACLCARAVLPAKPEGPHLAALTAAEAWVFKPNDDNRQAALVQGEDGGSSAAAMAAKAAAWSGGSLVPPDLEPVPPADDLTGRAVGGAFVKAAYGGDPSETPRRIRLFLAQGCDIAQGGNGRVNAEGERLEGAA